MFRLIRYYSLASAVAILAATVVLVVLYRQNAVNELIETAEIENVALARSFANIIWPKFSPYIASVSGQDGDALRARPETRQIHAALVSITAGLPVLKVKIYDLDGLTVYSSEPSQIGAYKSDNQGFLTSALEGNPASKLSYRDTFSAFSGMVDSRDLVETYIPIHGGGGAIEGVFELYTDVTPLKSRIDYVTIKLVVSLLLVFGLLYGALSLIVRRADRILKRQYADLLYSKEIFKAQNDTLEHEITERRFAEESLQEAHATLERRVQQRTVALESEIAERKRMGEKMRAAKEQAELANRAKSEFLANMSHELRTPLNAIIGFSEMISRETFGPIGSPKYVEYVKDINVSGTHLLELINHILDLSKIEAGKTELEETEIEVSRAIRACLALVRGKAHAGSVDLDLDIASDLLALYADEVKLKQILINLLSNAIKFTPEGGKVVLRIWSSCDDGYVFQIADTGIGIALEDIPKVLAPFMQVDSGLNRQYEGTGLGLSLSKAIAELHGGSLDIQSEVGVGTTVTVCFPAERIVREAAKGA